MPVMMAGSGRHVTRCGAAARPSAILPVRATPLSAGLPQAGHDEANAVAQADAIWAALSA